MVTTIRGRYRRGHIEPFEPLDLVEDAEVTITVTDGPIRIEADGTLSSAGAWDGLLDCGRFEREVYESRTVQTRPAVEL
ncbi:MAG: antitoxin family protein [Armatimonadetes bacterium]|nr:antitoxin family protein [Armatimonadota bacterium]